MTRFSIASLCQSPVDGKPMLLTPEESIQIQVDDVVKTTITGPRIEEAMYRTLRWIDRCIAANLASYCDSYAIGGLAGGEDKDSFWRVVAQCTAALPEDKPRYVMGVGYPLDVVVCSALGADMYDCVFPTRTARFGTALVPELSKDLHKSIVEGRFPEYVCTRFFTCTGGLPLTYFFFSLSLLQFPKGDIPEWVCNAMEVAGVDISTCIPIIN
ncbi:hypothetical protein BHM03_00019654 [Ensete ventricosum]|uniref:tRNA-guanine(15) transglycosylase-like domain-containing protein n=1 Tax=Ensete ventricosum TaxID=4639 RepID=A0A445MFT1_ENSVE|nr:hypothetical protein BHM03_00019654 [Ensete ventricosum]